jgi:hypothetical protein
MIQRLSRERDAVLSSLLRFSAVASAVAYIPGVMVAVLEGLWSIAIVDTLAYAIVLIAAFASSVPSTIKLIFLVGSSLLVGMVVLINRGPLGAGYIWLMVAVVLSSLFGLRRLVAATIGLCVAFMVAWGLAISLGADGHGATPLTVLIIGASLLVACLMLAVVTQRLLIGLDSALAEREMLASRLTDELAQSNAVRAELKSNLELKEELLRELQHRVRNNLQAVQSLLSIEEETDSAFNNYIGDNKRRIGALTITNDLFLANPEDGRIDGYELIRSIAQQVFDDRREGVCSVSMNGSTGATLDPQTSVLVAVLSSDLIASLAVASPLLLSFEGRRLGLRLEFRSTAGYDTVFFETVFQRIASGRIARSCAHEISIGSIVSDGVREGGIFLEVMDRQRHDRVDS